MFFRKHKILVFLISFCVFSNALISQTTDYFIKSYNLQANSYGGNIFELNDEGFINSAANIDTVAIAPGDTAIIEVISMYRVNKSGGLVWAKNYKLTSDCAYGGSIWLSKDSTIAFATVLTDTVTFNPDYLFFKTDLNGNYLMSNAIGTAGNEYAMDIKQLSDESYVLCGYSDGNTVGTNKGDYSLVKLNKNGSLNFSKLYFDGNVSYDFPVGLDVDKNDNVFIYGNSNYTDTSTWIGYNYVQILKTDINGSLLWLQKIAPVPIFNNVLYYTITSATISKSNQLVVVGNYGAYDSTNVNDLSDGYATLSFINQNGTIQYSKKYGFNNEKYSSLYFNTIKQNSKKEFVVTYSASDSLYNSYVGLILLDSTGVIKKTKIFSDQLYYTKINTIKHNGIVMNGNDYIKYNSVIAKLDSNLNVDCGRDTSLFFETPINFVTTFGGTSINLGTEHPSSVTENQKNIGDSIWCQKTVVIVTPTSTVMSIPQTEVVVEIPNVFTPNNDGRNEFFGVKSNYPLDVFHLIIYDRWGLKVFESTNYQEFWNGNYLQNGAACTDGTYFFIVNFNVLNESKKEHGFLTLLR